ncbi:MAG: hypothetical protein A3B68_00760 [Candidatus Melainabacteria bacterium RIFCSPHIGHO2_02_FULL_34_12]|nr:MAG: hypothetical protein A3B68_00760 [Candidatus Melainabacteria bacterium RIFCSPHIGHO2_02_FULL_34_12]
MSKSEEHGKARLIRELLLKTIGRNPDLFTYYVSILEAKNLLPDREDSCLNQITKKSRPHRKLCDG